ncbi:NAD(P)-dependent oxidoreductase, partial [bacterium]|nr:NAD(P)-dependent oxidoreductase [bacterium]
MRVLVTGGTGFVGSHIVDRLVADGHDVVVAKRVSSNLRWLSPDKIELIDAPMEHLEPLSEILPEMDAVVHASG